MTGIEEGQVCKLNSESTGCSDDDNLATSHCLCYRGVVDRDCQGQSVAVVSLLHSYVPSHKYIIADGFCFHVCRVC